MGFPHCIVLLLYFCLLVLIYLPFLSATSYEPRGKAYTKLGSRIG